MGTDAGMRGQATVAQSWLGRCAPRSPGLGPTTSQTNPVPCGAWGWLHPRATVAAGRIWPHRQAERPLGAPSSPLLAGQFHLLPKAAPALCAVLDGAVHGAPPCGALEGLVFMSTQPHLASGASCLYSCLPEPQWVEVEGLVKRVDSTPGPALYKLCKSLNLSEPQFSHLLHGCNNASLRE